MSVRVPAPPKYRHYKPKNLAVVRIDGHDVYLGRYGSPESQEKYRRVVAEWNLTGTVINPAPQAAEPAPMTVGELVLAFWRDAETYYRRADGTPTGELENYRYAFNPVVAMFGSTPARDFKPKALKLVRQHMIDAGLSRGLINRRVQRIVRLFGFGVENETLPADAHHALKAVKALGKGRSQARETERVLPVAEEHVEAVKPFLSRQLATVIALQWLTGMRSSEALTMRTIDIDTAAEIWEYVPDRHKGSHLDKERRVFLGPAAQAIVREWFRPNLMEPLFQPREAEAERRAEQRRNRKSPMTPSQSARRPKGKPRRAPGLLYNSRAYALALRRACRKAGIPHWHPHQLRHSAATRIKREFDVETARVILGHSSPVITETYCEEDRQRAIDAVRKSG